MVPEWECLLDPPPLLWRELGLGGVCWQDMKAAPTLPWLCCPCHGGEGGMGGQETKGHPLPSTSCDLHVLLPSAGGIYNVPLWGQKTTLEIKYGPLCPHSELLRLWVANQTTKNTEGTGEEQTASPWSEIFGY